ncbi:SAM-dependent methyltransferase [Streptomyces sp. AC563]|uniref:SAM-dependent methyltransferase n=1 Tax=Streptomyces buecherae TaxID=2763006 RepID=UPI00164DB913|nr:SAM-dependent methyltransferase [Streptomyces buecherae]MBC3990408.1 SAM-dependent methyltransferase [Streptomyces buecherae]
MNVYPTGTNTVPEDHFQRAVPPRVHTALLGGCDAYEVDQAVARRLLAVAPHLPAVLDAAQQRGRAAVGRIARDLGIAQFLDLGCGYPSRAATTYSTVRAVTPAARVVYVVYVDCDPVVVAHGRAHLAKPGCATVVHGDICRIEEVLTAAPVRALDRAQPIAVLLHDVLPWVGDEVATAAMAALRAWLPAGSALSLTHAASDFAPEVMAEVVAVYATAGITYRPRAVGEVRALLGSWSLVSPGVVPVVPGAVERVVPLTVVPRVYTAIAVAPSGSHPLGSCLPRS